MLTSAQLDLRLLLWQMLPSLRVPNRMMSCQDLAPWKPHEVKSLQWPGHRRHCLLSPRPHRLCLRPLGCPHHPNTATMILPRCRHPARGRVDLHLPYRAQLQLRRLRPGHLHHLHLAACLGRRYPPTAQDHLQNPRLFERTAMKRSQSTTGTTTQTSPPPCRTRTLSRPTGGSQALRTPFQSRRPRRHLPRCHHPSPLLPLHELCLLHLLCRASRRQRVGRILDDLILDDLLTLLGQHPLHLHLQTWLRQAGTIMTLTTTPPLRRLLGFLLRRLSPSRRPRRPLVRMTSTRSLHTSHNRSRGVLLPPRLVGLRPLPAVH